jgi:predicted GNAT superfamily acetyltransferase
MSAQQEDSIRIMAVRELADLDSCVQLLHAVWGYSAADLVPKRVFVVANAIGGQVIGAFGSSGLVGFVMALPGYRNGQAYLHSHMLAVLPQYRNAGIGRRLKLAQREEALREGFDRIEWTFDPLEIKNAYLNIERLGAIARRYIPDFYGPSTSPLQGSLPTDRLVAEWWLRTPRVESAIQGFATGNPQARSQNRGKDVERIAVAAAVSEWKADPEQRSLALSLQTRNRIAFEEAFGRGLAVAGYECSPEGDGCFLLQTLSSEDTGPGNETPSTKRTHAC